MIAIFSMWHYLLLLGLYVAPAVMFVRHGNTGALVFMGSALVFLFLFSIVCRIVALKNVPNVWSKPACGSSTLRRISASRTSPNGKNGTA